jgi:hypothetical protein
MEEYPMSLSHFQIEKAKPRDKPYRLFDGEGLHLLVKPTGRRSWVFRYMLRGKENMLSFGGHVSREIRTGLDTNLLT